MPEYLTNITTESDLVAGAHRICVGRLSGNGELAKCVELLDEVGLYEPIEGSYVYWLAMGKKVVAVAEVTYPNNSMNLQPSSKLLEARMQTIGVDPKKQNQKLGRALIQVIIKDANDSFDISRINISSVPQARYFYDSLVKLGILAQEEEPLRYKAVLDS